MRASKLSRAARVIVCVALAIPAVAVQTVQATTCSDVQIVFARGSNRVPDDYDYNGFVRDALLPRIAAPVVPSTYQLGTVGFNGFKYIPADTLALADEFLNGASLGYLLSVESGVAELVNYLPDRASLCPNEVFVLAGYSEGAQVIGRGLTFLPQNVRDRVAFVPLFGDPTLDTGNWVTPLTPPIGPWVQACNGGKRPWIRGSIDCRAAGGIFGGRTPYLPVDMDQRVGSWCRLHDTACTGNLGDIGGAIVGGFPDADHTKYFLDDAGSEANYAAREAAFRLKTYIPAHASSFDATYDQFVDGQVGADLVIIFDTTGSMSGAINDAKAQATALAQQWTSLFTNARVGLAEFKDVGQGDPFVARLDLGLTSDASAFQAAVNALSASGGGDTPEAQLSGIMTALDGVSWQPGATKAVVVITDATGKDPEPVSNFTRASVDQHALEIDPVAIYGVSVSSQAVADWMGPMAAATAGDVILLAQGQSLSAALSALFDSVHANPVAKLDSPLYAQTGTAVNFNAGDSFDAAATITNYNWDFDGNGSIDRTTTSPTTSFTYAGVFQGIASVEVMASDGRSALATADVSVDSVGLTNLRPIAPTSASASMTGTNQATVTWTVAANDLANGYKVVLADGTVIGWVDATGAHSIVINDIDLNQPIQLYVRASNAYGESGSAATQVVGGSSAWSPSVVVTNDPVVDGIHALMPAVGMSVNNTGLALWARYHTGTDYDIYAARRDPTNGAWDAPVRANDVTTGAQYYPAVAFDQSNNAYAVWVDERNARRDIYFSKRSASTGLWSANIRVNSDTTFSDQTTPAIAVSSTGEAIAVWYRKVGTNKYYIYSARLPAGASTWSTSFKVTPSQSPDRGAPDVTIAPNGTAYAVWVEPRTGNADIWFASLPLGSTTWSAASRISDDPGTAFQGDPEIGVDGAGNLIVAWDDWRTSPHQVRVRRKPAGGSWAPSVVVSANGSNGPSLSVGSDGRAFVAWQDGPYPPTGNAHVWGSTYDATAGTWSAAERLDDGGTADSASQPAGAISGSKTVLIWQNATSLQGGGRDNQVWARWKN